MRRRNPRADRNGDRSRGLQDQTTFRVFVSSDTQPTPLGPVGVATITAHSATAELANE
jgi:hypothetical protein